MSLVRWCLPPLFAEPRRFLTRRSGRASVPKVIVDAPGPVLRCERGVPIDRSSPGPTSVEGARQKQNGKWSCPRLFPGQEFDDFDAFRAAKKQHVEQRAACSDQLHAFRGPLRGRRR